MKLQHKAWHMTARPIQPDADRVQTRSNQLNRDCFCITLEQDVLCREIEKKTEDPEFCATYIRTRPNLFSNVPMFIFEFFRTTSFRNYLGSLCSSLGVPQGTEISYRK